jgi:hypothetical protein
MDVEKTSSKAEVETILVKNQHMDKQKDITILIGVFVNKSIEEKKYKAKYQKGIFSNSPTIKNLNET